MSAAQVEELFEAWRRGDAAAGQTMAQRFTDWYYAIACAHQGESMGQTSYADACQRFSQGVASVPDVRRLAPWAVSLAAERIRATPATPSGNLPGKYTRNEPPQAFLDLARQALPQETALLVAAYSGTRGPEPIQVLEARYALKRWLVQNYQIPFKVIPAQPDPDFAPLPYYEARRMTRPEELSRFELFLLEEPDACQDIAEFAHFAIALRGSRASSEVLATGGVSPLRATITKTKPASAAPTQRLEPTPAPAPQAAPTSAEPPPANPLSALPPALQDWRVLAVIGLVIVLGAAGFGALLFALLLS